jgi:hypothetical protein
VPDPEAALDALYGAAPDEFVPTRTRLVAELRVAGDTETAARIQRLRRPPLAVWAVNQAARREPETVADLFAATHDLAAAQRDMLAGTTGSDALRAATKRRHELLAALTDGALTALGEHAPNPATHRAAIAGTIDAATLDPEAVDDLRTGRLTRALAPPASFGPLDVPGVARAPVTTSRRPSVRQIAKAERDLDAARRAADEAARVAEEAEAEVASADLAAEAALAHLQEVDRARDRARDELAHTSTRLSEAQRAVIAARAAVDEAIRAVSSHEARVSDLQVR